ncbi:hypothetical protein RMB13_19150 [Acinetobacter sp. V102_4]|uniref:hypothetical protein n=1 Tax=Acinetobacter sp. V102_4 TaxID=3072984 RepID=UPI00287E5E03|nr:hypothetical protein [Acinetobacter sp. V102_4]MDS7931561.1 hypothetical protein [Acinetobacter sp. V102_4]
MHKCPYCHSQHLKLLRQSEQTHQSVFAKLSSFSPMSLAAACMQLSKRSPIHPLVGGFVGLVVGGMFLLYVQHQDNTVTLHYQCEQCLQHFEIEQSGFS